MSEVNQWDNIEAFQPKECYDLAAYFEVNDASKELLRDRSKKLNLPNNYIPIQLDVTCPETEMQTISETMQQLSIESLSTNGAADFKYTHRINNLADSAEKEFVLALLSLRNGTYETQRINALNHIRVALSYSPNDPRFIALARVLQEADK